MSVAFDMQAWMRGGELPVRARTRARKRPKRALARFYGVHVTGKGFSMFVASTPDKAPPNVLTILEARPGENPQELAQALLRTYEVPWSSRGTVPVGGVGIHCDGGRTHTAICLGTHTNGELMLLFLTSHPRWNRFARKITHEEACLIGRPYNEWTFLAPVLRPGDVSWTAGLTVPAHRVAELRNEFFNEGVITAVAVI